jgi:hypothetical protein
MVVFSLFCIVLLVVALTFSVSVNLRFGKMLVNVEDNVQSCLDMVDARYNKLMHVFDDSPGTISDDPLVRNFLYEVSKAREDMLIIANILSRTSEPLGISIGDQEESDTQNAISGEIPTSENDLLT